MPNNPQKPEMGTRSLPFTRELYIDADDFEEVAGEADTLAGLLLEIKGEFPQLHETLHCNGIAFEVMQRNQHRIVKIKVTAPAGSKTAE